MNAQFYLKNPDGKGLLGCHRHRWEDNIKIILYEGSVMMYPVNLA